MVNLENVQSEVENQAKIRENVLEIFRKLSKNKEKIVVQNGVKLLRHLVENQKDENGKDELKYTLSRLIRGLGASSNETKQGYYTVLVGLLNCVDVTISNLLEIGDRELHTSGGNSKSENADISSGQILLYGAVIRSEMVEKANEAEKKVIVEKLLTAGKKRTYLYLLAATFINQLCNNVDETDFKSNLWPVISPELTKPWPEQNVDTLYLLFVLNDRFPSTLNKKYLQTILGSEEIVCNRNLVHLANILINMPRLETANHPVYDLICKSLTTEKFATTFITEADKLLTRYNYNRHVVFTLILTSIVSNLKNISVLPNLITKNYLQQTLQYFKTVKGSKKPEQLQEKIYELLNKILETLKNNGNGVTSEIKISVLKKLLFDPGTFIFEKITRTKVVQHIIAGLDQKGVKSIGDVFKNVIRSERDARKVFLNNDKVYATQLLVKLLGHDSMKENFNWKIDQMKFLMELGFVKSERYSHIGNELSGCIRQSFYKALMTKQQSFNNVRIMLWKLAQHLNPYMKKVSLRCAVEEDTKTSWDLAYRTFEEIERKESNQLNHVYQTLFLFLGFHVFQDTNLTKESLLELQSCYERINNVTSDNELHFSEVMVDLFLCLLSYNSSLIRNLVNMVFPHFTKHLTDTAFQQILYVLDPDNKDILGRKGMRDNEEEEMDTTDDDADEDNDSGTEQSDSSENENINEKLKEAVQVALGQFGDEEIDLDDMSESEGQRLDDALAMAFKKNVTKKPKKQSHKENLKMNFRIRVLDLVNLYFENEPSLINCIESLPMLLRLEEFTIRDPFQKQLLERVNRSVKKLSTLKKFGSIEGLLQENKLKEFLSLHLSLLERGDKNVFMMQAMRESISHSCIFFVHCAQYLVNSNRLTIENRMFLTESIENITTIALDSYFLQRDALVPFEMFKTIIRMNYFGLYNLINNVLSFIYLENLKLFKKIQAVDLAKDFFKNHRFLTSNTSTDDFKCALGNFIETTENIFEYSIENKTLIQEKFARSLLELLITIKNSPIEISYNTLINTIEKYPHFTKATKTSFNKLCKYKDDGANEESTGLKPRKLKKTLGKLKSRMEEEKTRYSVEGVINLKRKSVIFEEDIKVGKKKKLDKNLGEGILNGDVSNVTNGKVSNKNKRRSLNVEKGIDKGDFVSIKTLKVSRKSNVF